MTVPPPQVLKIFLTDGQTHTHSSFLYKMTSEGLWEMFEGDFADMCAEKFPLMSIKV